MKVKPVKINSHGVRIMVLCNYCEEKFEEIETYAIMEQKFRYICQHCLSAKLSEGRDIEVCLND